MDRRTLLTGAAAAALLPVRALADAAVNPTLLPFAHGVASGDPLSDRVILWTRVTGRGEAVPVRWVIAADPQLRKVVRSGTTTATSRRDHTVKVDADGLRPATSYWYAFEALGRRSMIGRTRTAPASSSTDRLRFGVVTCAKFESGYFNAYACVAEADVDAVLHLGDYIYEGGTDSDGLPGRIPDPTTEIRTVAEYRRRYAQYHLDPDLQRMHQQHPVVVTWDDHESSNDSWRDGAANHDAEAEGPWRTRKSVAQQVYDEWMPIRLPVPGNAGRIYRQLPYGGLVDLVVIDTRLEGRSQQLEGLDGDQVILDPRVADPARQMYSATQRSFIERSLTQSRATWKVVLNQVLISQFRAVGLPKAVTDALSSLGQSGLPTQGVALAADIWDGYTAERDRLLGFLRTAALDDVVFLTGDIHAALANDLSEDPLLRPSVAVELVTPSVTSTNFDEALGVPPRTTSLAIEAAIRTQNPNTKYVELDSNGYLLLDVTPQRLHGEWWFVDTLTERSTRQRLDATWQALRGANQLSAGGPVTTSRSSRPPAAPAAAVTRLSGTSGSTPAPRTGALPSTGAAATGWAALGLIGLAIVRRRYLSAVERLSESTRTSG